MCNGNVWIVVGSMRWVVYTTHMPRYSEAMRAVWAKKTPEERSARGRALAFIRWGFKHNKKYMDFTVSISGVTYVYSFEANTLTVTAADGTETVLSMQAVVSDEDVEVDVITKSGVTKKFVLAA